MRAGVWVRAAAVGLTALGIVAAGPAAAAAARGAVPAAAAAARGAVPAAAAAAVDSVRGVVVDVSSGAPLAAAGVRVVELDRGTQTDRHGRFVIRGLPPGEHTLEVRRWGYEPELLRVGVPGAAAEPGGDHGGEPGATGGPVEREVEIALSPRAFRLDEVVATASPFGEGAYQPARTLSREELQRRAATSIGEVLDGEPGVAMRSLGPAPARPVIRGMDGDRLLVLQNGERLGDVSETAFDHAITSDPLAADRVEIVRGPASLLYGSSALGGVINVSTEDIPRRWARGASGAVALQAATANELGAGFGQLRHGGERWATTLRGSLRGASDVRTPAGRVRGTHVEGASGAVGLGYAGDALDAGLAVSAISQTYGIPEALDDPFESVELRTGRFALQGRADWQTAGVFERVELRLSASRYTHDELEILELPGQPPEEELELSMDQRLVATTLTVRHGAAGPASRGALGVQLSARRLDTGGEDALTPHARSETVGLFVFQELDATAWLRLQAGARVERQTSRAKENERFPGFRAERAATTVSGAVGANLRPAPGLELGLQLARAHRSPMPEELYSDAAHLGTGRFEVGDPALRDEVGHGLDVFARFGRGRLRLELAGFHSRLDDFIILQPTADVDPTSGFPVHRYEADAAALTGWEASLEVRPTGPLRLEAGADYVRGTRRAAVREPLPFIPPLRASLGLTWDAGGWWLGGRTRTAAAQTRVAPEEAPTDGYTLLGLEAGLRLDRAGRHVLSLRADNVLDATYRDHLSRIGDRRVPMPGRNVNLTYRWAF